MCDLLILTTQPNSTQFPYVFFALLTATLLQEGKKSNKTLPLVWRLHSEIILGPLLQYKHIEWPPFCLYRAWVLAHGLTGIPRAEIMCVKEKGIKNKQQRKISKRKEENKKEGRNERKEEQKMDPYCTCTVHVESFSYEWETVRLRYDTVTAGISNVFIETTVTIRCGKFPTHTKTTLLWQFIYLRRKPSGADYIIIHDQI